MFDFFFQPSFTGKMISKMGLSSRFSVIWPSKNPKKVFQSIHSLWWKTKIAESSKTWTLRNTLIIWNKDYDCNTQCPLHSKARKPSLVSRNPIRASPLLDVTQHILAVSFSFVYFRNVVLRTFSSKIEPWTVVASLNLCWSFVWSTCIPNDFQWRLQIVWTHNLSVRLELTAFQSNSNKQLIG